MAVRVAVEPALLAWARDRARLELVQLASRFPKLEEWEAGLSQPTLKQLEAFARTTHTSLGFLLLPRPPQETVPIPDFRTIAGRPVERPSADLLDTIYACQQRQDWYRDYARQNREGPSPIAGSVAVGASVVQTAEAMRQALGVSSASRLRLRTWAEALTTLRDSAEANGVLVMISGIVGSDTHRKLYPAEFRGFALADPLAPLVFVNGADTKAAQIFTLAHELVHIWAGESALSDAEPRIRSGNQVERWCNDVAAEFLVPLQELRAVLSDTNDLGTELDHMAHMFKVSTLVVLKRMHDAGRLNWDDYRSAYAAERERVLGIATEPAGAGGNFYTTTPQRVSRRFARALISSTLEGQTLYRDAVRLLGFKKLSTLEALGHSLGIA